MYFNIKDIEIIIEGMKCDFADKIWNNYMRKEYSLKIKECSKEELVELESFIPIMESKLLLLKNFKVRSNYYNYPSKICKTDINSFWNADKILKDCDSLILEKFKQYTIQTSILNLSGNKCSTC